jgi:hypothetical protein
MDSRLKKLLRWCNVVLHVASWLVPHRQRVEWLHEWQGEIWHWAHFLVESDRLNAHTEQEVLGHCWGSFVDALWHRFVLNSWQGKVNNRDVHTQDQHAHAAHP